MRFGVHTDGWQRFGTWALALLLAFVSYIPVHAQVPDNEPQWGDVPISDSLRARQDSIAKIQKKVRERTLWVDPNRMLDNLSYRNPVTYNLADVLEPDLLWRLPGFYNWLGQIGKPYRRYVYGMESSFYRPKGLFFNPFTGAEDVHIIDPETGMSYYDTRTPFVNVYYGQGAVDLAQLRVDIAQNISPFVNAGVLYYRRQSTGAYSGFITDHNNVGFNVNGHTPKDHYHAFVTGTFHEGNDDINGGVAQVFPYEELFSGSSQPTALSEARISLVHRAIHLRHSLRILGDSISAVDTSYTADSVMVLDSATHPHQLRVYHGVLADYFQNQFTDTLLDRTVNRWENPVYPTWGDTTVDHFYERFKQERFKTDGGVSYRFKTPQFETGHRGEIAKEWIRFEKDLQTRYFYRFTTGWNGDFRYSPAPFELRADGRFSNTVSNRFKSENFLELGASLGLGNAKFNYARKVPGPIRTETDSVLVTKTHRPLTVFLRSLAYGRNPTLQQAYGAGNPPNDFISDRNLRNSSFRQVRGGVEWRMKDSWTKYGEVPGTFVALTGFVSRINSMIYYDTSMVLQQAPDTTFVQWQGLEVKGRLKLRKLYLENTTVFQAAFSNDPILDSLYAFYQPVLYGRASIYYENKDLRIAAIIRMGVDCYYNLSYHSPLFDPPSQQFYPQAGFVQPGYARVDAFFSTQVKRAYIFVKLVNALDRTYEPGYFTTRWYPMLGRTLMLGVNWTFLD